MSRRAMIHLGRDAAGSLAVIRTAGADVIANYGQSALVRAETQQLKQIAAKGLRVREMEDTSSVQIGAYTVDTNKADALSTSVAARAASDARGASRHVVHVAGPMHPDWRRMLERLGVVLHQSLSENAHLATIPSDKVDDVQALDFVEAVTPYAAPLKINPALLTAAVQRDLKAPASMKLTIAAGSEPAMPAAPGAKKQLGFHAARPSPSPSPETGGNLELVLFSAEDVVVAADAVRSVGARVIRTADTRLIVFAAMALVPQLAAVPQVREINPYRPPRLHNEVATGILHNDVLHNDHGLTGAGQIVGIGDSGIDTGVNDATMLDDFEGRLVNVFALGRVGDASDPHGHGTHVAGSVLGNGANSNGVIRGSAPAAQLVFQSLLDAAGGLGGIPANLGIGLFDVARDQGARIHTNSWGADVNGAYNANASEADAFAFANREMLILFSAGNDGPNRIGSPGTAKNVLTVGASESLRVLPAIVHFPASPSFPTGAQITGLNQEADDQNDVSDFSSVGPAQNNRRKPDVVAPGTWILSTRSSVAVKDTGPDGFEGTGDEDGVATHAESVGFGLPGQPLFGGGDVNSPPFPGGVGALADGNYMYDSGTSMATPLTAGSCALVRQYLVEQRGHTPSGALIKALMINGAVDMGGGVPNNSQGWGRADLTSTLFPAGTGRVQFDDALASAVQTGDIRTYDVFVSSAAQPLAVTLVWRDPAGNTIQNRLHLRVINVATSATFTADAIADIRNNVQKVIVPVPDTGLWHVEVEGASVGTGITELLPDVRQDYALVVSNGTGFSCNPSDVVQVIDRSGSMGFSGYMEPAKDRAKQMIDILQINDKAGVVKFDSAATGLFPLSLVDSQAVKDVAHAAIDPLVSAGTTDLREALDQGVTTLGPDLGRPRAIVFISDGKHTVATPPIDDAQLAAIAAQGIRVFTIALGPDSDFTVLNNIANRTGTGAVNSVASAADLHVLHEIYYSILGGIGCGGVVHLSSASVTETLVESVPVGATTSEAHFAVSWQDRGADFAITLRDPSGKVYDAATKEAFRLRGSTHEFFRVTRPKPGVWKMNVKVLKNPSDAPLKVTTAVLADSDLGIRLRVDRKFLFHANILIELRATFGGKPLTGGQAFADVTFPTVSAAALLKKHAEALKAIRVPASALNKDTPDPSLIRLGIFAAQQAAKGADVFKRKTVRLPLRDDGTAPERKKNDGVYAAFFDPSANKVAGSFQIKAVFEVNKAKTGRHRRTELLSVFVPTTT